MPLIDSDSKKCDAQELNLFSIHPTDVSFPDSQRWHVENPVTSISSGGAIDFIINSSPDVYLDLRNSYIDLEFSIKDETGQILQKTLPTDTSDNAAVATALTSNKNCVVFPEQYFIGSAFKNVEVYLNDALISSSDNLYPYRAYIETLLSYNKNVKDEQMKMSGWYEDTGDDIEWKDADILAKEVTTGVKNTGAYYRFQITKYSKKVQMIGKIHSDLFNQYKYLPGKNQLRLKFIRHNPEFCLRSGMDGKKFTFNIDKMSLNIKKCEISPHIRELHERQLLADNTETLKYSFPHVQMKFFMHPASERHIAEPNLCNGLLPNKVIIGMVSSNAFNGDFDKNPFNFRHFGATSVILRKNGVPAPFEELTLDYPNGQYLQGYLSLILGTGRLYDNDSFGISPSSYKNGKCLYMFDLSNTSTKDCMSLQQTGKLQLNIRLDENISEGVTVICYLQYDSVLHINHELGVSLSNRNGVSEI